MLHAATWIVWAAAAVVSVQLAPNVLYASLVLLLAVLVLLPVFWLGVTSVTDDAHAHFTLRHYRQLVVDRGFLEPLWVTLWTSAAVGFLCVAFAAPMAWLAARTDLPAKRLMRMMVLASFATPPFLGAFAWVLLGGPNAGLADARLEDRALVGLLSQAAREVPSANPLPSAEWSGSSPPMAA